MPTNNRLYNVTGTITRSAKVPATPLRWGTRFMVEIVTARGTETFWCQENNWKRIVNWTGYGENGTVPQKKYTYTIDPDSIFEDVGEITGIA